MITNTTSTRPGGGWGIALVLSAVTLAAILAHAPAQGGNSNPGIIPPHAKFRGLTYGEWGAKWWQAAFACPVVAGAPPTTPSFLAEHFVEIKECCFWRARGGGRHR